MDLLEMLIDELDDELCDVGSPSRVRAALDAAEKRLRMKYGGAQVYLAKRRKDAHDAPRDFLIGKSVRDVMRKYGVSRATAYRYLKRGVR